MYAYAGGGNGVGSQFSSPVVQSGGTNFGQGGVWIGEVGIGDDCQRNHMDVHGSKTDQTLDIEKMLLNLVGVDKDGCPVATTPYTP